MANSGYKCLVCSSCTEWLIVGGERFVYCDFCDEYYRLVPGRTLVDIEDTTRELLENAHGRY